MSKKILLAGMVGAVVVFLVSAIFHMATSLGEIGIKTLPNEDATLAAMRASISDPGFYLFPGAGMMSDKGMSLATQAAYLAKFKAGPTGVLIYRTGGEDLSFGKLLGYQFVLGLFAALFLAWILGITASATTYGSRVLIVFLISLFAGFVYDLPYWTWYGFPTNYVVAHIATWTVSWTIAGLAMAPIFKRPAAMT
jgi:hypothetical protein